MSQRPTCPVCGVELPAGASPGFCPKCLLLQARRDGEGESAPSANGSEPPALPEFGGYALLERVGQGGMGIVYRARQTSLDRIVALKVLPHGALATKEQVLRFRAEAAAAGSLQHPNIVAIHEVGLCEDRHYLVMDFVEGQTLAQVISHSKFQIDDCRRAARYVQKIAEAVHYAHERGILHRDLKPSNVLIDAIDEPRITDFGLAKRLDSATDLTLSGQVLGSPQYMPPEQAAGRHRQVGRRSDIYALGATLYHLLTGRPPFVGETLADLLPQVTNDEPLRPRQLNPAIPTDLETICLKCLEKETHRRYPTALALAEELGRFLRGEPIEARPLSAAGKSWRWCRRKPQVASAIAAAMLIALAGVIGITWEWRRAKAGELMAGQNAQVELEQRRRAEASEYAADMNLAQHALDEGNVGLALSLLNRHRPEGKAESRKQKIEKTVLVTDRSLDRPYSRPATDLRGWEWRYLWQLCQADPCVSLQTNSGSFGPMAISQDAKVMATATGHNPIAVWGLTGKRLIKELPDHAEIRTLALSRTGRLLGASTGLQGAQAVEVWDLNTGQRRATFQRPAIVRSLAFSPDETLLASLDDRGTVVLVDWAVNHTVTTFSVPTPAYGGTGIVSFSPDGTRLAVGLDWGRVCLWDLRTGNLETLTNLAGPTDAVTTLAFSPTTELLAAGSEEAICVRRLGSGESFFLKVPGEVSALAFSPDGKVLVSATGDQTIRLWSIADQAQLGCWRGHIGEGQALAFLPDGQTLVSACKAGAACFWEVNGANPLWAHAALTNSYALGSEASLEPTNFLEAPGHAPGPLDPKAVRRFAFVFTPDSRSFLTTDRDGWLGVWNAKTARLKERLPDLGSNLWGVAFSPDSRWLVTGQASGTVGIWDWQSRVAITNQILPFGWFGRLRFSQSGKFLLATSILRDRRVHLKIWRTNDWAEVELAPAQVAGVFSADLSPDDRHLAAGYIDDAVRLWSFPEGRLEAAFTNHAGGATVLFSHDGQRLVSASLDTSVRLWDLAGHRQTAELRGHLGQVWAAALSPDGQRLATSASSAKDAVKLWDPATQRLLLTLPAEGAYFVHVAFSPDGNTLIATSFGGVAHLWRAPSWEEMAAAESGASPP